MLEQTVAQCLGLTVAAAVLIYVGAWIASKAFFQAKFDYNKRLAKALMEGDRSDD